MRVCNTNANRESCGWHMYITECIEDSYLVVGNYSMGNWFIYEWLGFL